MLADSLETWLRKNYGFSDRQRSLSAKESFSREVWGQFAEQGWLGLMFPESLNGFGGGGTELRLLMEAMGAALVREPIIANLILAGQVLSQSTSGAEYIEPIVSGERQFALAFAERQSRYDTTNIATRATKVVGGYKLSGEKCAVLNGNEADFVVVSARMSGNQGDREGIGLFLVDSSRITRHGYPTHDGSYAADIVLDRVFVEERHLLLDGSQADRVLADVIDLAAYAVCAEAVGIMTRLLNATINYSKERKQFGVPIGSFQSLQHRMADMYNECEQAKSIVMWCSSELDAQAERARIASAVSACKSYVGKASRFVGQAAIQIHGGIGVTWELDVPHYFKRLTMIELLFGNADWHTRRFARIGLSRPGSVRAA